MKPLVSVVVPAYNEEEGIHTCLDSLVTQKTEIPFEVVVVDNNSTDKTVAEVKKYTEKINLRVVTERIQGRGAARARGFREAKGDVIFSTDADTIFFDTWIDLFYKTLTSSKKIVAVSGSCYINDNTRFHNWIFNTMHPYWMLIYRLVFGHYWLSGFSYAIKKDIYEKAGGINPSLNALDDVDLAFRVRKLGEIRCIKNPRVIMSGRRFQKHFFRGLFSYAVPFYYIYTKKTASVDVSNPR